MPATVVVGMGYGDEGKGKIIDRLAEHADLIARYNGGDNAGHTVYVGNDKFTLHVLPSGSVRGKRVALGAEVALNPNALKAEIEELNKRGVYFDLVIDNRTHVITDEHIKRDEAGSKDKIGTTGKGIGPLYEDWVGRRGMMMVDYAKDHPEFKGFLGDVSILVDDYLDADKNVLMEGAQGTGLSITWGTYPYVTSSEPTAGGACKGLGVGPTRIDKVIGVAKACLTRVGNGPFPSELGGKKSEEYCKDKTHGKLFELEAYGIPHDVIKEGDKTKIEYYPRNKKILEMMNSDDEFTQGVGLRLAGDEYGATTGRPRRTGWFDVVLARHAARVNGIKEIVLTKLDVLSDLKKLRVCKYYERDGEEIREFPPHLEGCEPFYAELDGWRENICNSRKFEDLPENAQRYVVVLEALIAKPITVIGVGPEREQIILRK